MPPDASTGIENIKGVTDALKEHFRKLTGTEARSQTFPSVIVGYLAEYALAVHENLEAKHGADYNAAYIKEAQVMNTRGKNKGKITSALFWTQEAIERGYHKKAGGKKKKPRLKRPEEQAKFLSTPARQMRGELIAIINSALRNGATIIQALYVGGLALQRASQLIVPVDTANLKAGAFTRKE